jgi:hypothetical protein
MPIGMELDISNKATLTTVLASAAMLGTTVAHNIARTIAKDFRSRVMIHSPELGALATNDGVLCQLHKQLIEAGVLETDLDQELAIQADYLR